MASDEKYRQACKRSHVLLAKFLSIEGWRKHVDGFVLDASVFRGYFKIEAIKAARQSWFLEDIKPLFPFSIGLIKTSGNGFGSFYFSRKNFYIDGNKAATDYERLEQIGISSFCLISAIPIEQIIQTHLQNWASGNPVDKDFEVTGEYYNCETSNDDLIKTGEDKLADSPDIGELMSGITKDALKNTTIQEIITESVKESAF